MSDDYVIWSFDEVANALTPKDLLNAEDIAMALRTGDSIPKGSFEDLQFTADPDYPDDALLTDCIGNNESVIPISDKLKNHLESINLSGIEYLPVVMLDQNGNAHANYYILHATNVIDCVDQNKTKLRVNRLTPNMYNKVRDLKILANKIPEGTGIFRIKGVYNGTCVHRSIAEDITQKGFTGVYWKEFEEYRY